MYPSTHREHVDALIRRVNRAASYAQQDGHHAAELELRDISSRLRRVRLMYAESAPRKPRRRRAARV
jgi:hypothetical protein